MNDNLTPEQAAILELAELVNKLTKEFADYRKKSELEFKKLKPVSPTIISRESKRP